MAEIRTTHLFTMTLAVAGMQPIGATPSGNRRIGLVAGGTFQGDAAARQGAARRGRLDHRAPDGATTLDVRLVLETDDGAAIGMTYRGMRHGPAAVMERLNRGEVVDPAEYYFRIAVAFETAAAKYDWLNRDHSRSAPDGVRRKGRSTTCSRCCEPWRRSASSAWATWARRWRRTW